MLANGKNVLMEYFVSLRAGKSDCVGLYTKCSVCTVLKILSLMKHTAFLNIHGIFSISNIYKNFQCKYIFRTPMLLVIFQ